KSPVVRLKFPVSQVERLHDPLFTVTLPPYDPIHVGKYSLRPYMGDKGLLHLPKHRIRKDHSRHPVEVGKIKGKHGKIVHLLDRRGSEDNDVVSAVPPALDGLEIIRLGRIYTAESRP